MKFARSPIDLNPFRDPSGRLTVIIETPRGSRNKFKFDLDLDLFRIDKILPLGAAFPFDFGFVPQTVADDGDPLDVLVLMDECAFTGCAVTVRLLGGIIVRQTENDRSIRNDRLIGAVETHRNPALFQSLADVGDARLAEIEHFFRSYNEAEGRQFEALARCDADEARSLAVESHRRYQATRDGR